MAGSASKSVDVSHLRPWRSLWPLRALWLLQPLLLGPALSTALDDTGRGTQLVVSTAAWLVWAAALMAMLVPRTVTLTVVRASCPGVLPLATWAAVASGETASGAVAAAGAVAVLVCLAMPGVADGFVDGSSYGSERRVALRVPVALLVGPVALTWSATAGLVAVALLAGATQRWIVLVAAGAVAALAVRAVLQQLHQLSRRWLVFVPAGVVVHDPLTLTEPLLVPRAQVRRFGPAATGGPSPSAPSDDETGTDGAPVDLTAGASGLVLEIVLSDPVDVGLRVGRGGREVDAVSVLQVVPTQPMQTLALAGEARIAVGVA